jgi:hypothetical protein
MPQPLHLPETLLALALSFPLAACPPAAVAGQQASRSDKTTARAALRDMRKQALAELYQQDPKARVAIRGAAGYAVFESAGAHVLFVGGAGGAVSCATT